MNRNTSVAHAPTRQIVPVQLGISCGG
jgi:hypothetical protein